MTRHPPGARSPHPGFPGPPLAPPCPPLVLRTRQIPTSRQRPDVVEREDSPPSRVPVKVYGRSGGQEVQGGQGGQGKSGCRGLGGREVGGSGDWGKGGGQGVKESQGGQESQGVRGSEGRRGSGGQRVRGHSPGGYSGCWSREREEGGPLTLPLGLLLLGMFCSSEGLSRPSGLCHPTHYCSGGAVSPTPIQHKVPDGAWPPDGWPTCSTCACRSTEPASSC